MYLVNFFNFFIVFCLCWRIELLIFFRYCFSVRKFLFVLYWLIFIISMIELIFDVRLFIILVMFFWVWFIEDCLFVKFLVLIGGWIWILNFFRGLEVKFRVIKFKIFFNFLSFCFSNLFCVEKDFLSSLVCEFIWLFCVFIRFVSLSVFCINVIFVFLMEFLICFKRM